MQLRLTISTNASTSSSATSLHATEEKTASEGDTILSPLNSSNTTYVQETKQESTIDIQDTAGGNTTPTPKPTIIPPIKLVQKSPNKTYASDQMDLSLKLVPSNSLKTRSSSDAMKSDLDLMAQHSVSPTGSDTSPVTRKVSSALLTDSKPLDIDDLIHRLVGVNYPQTIQEFVQYHARRSDIEKELYYDEGTPINDSQSHSESCEKARSLKDRAPTGRSKTPYESSEDPLTPATPSAIRKLGPEPTLEIDMDEGEIRQLCYRCREIFMSQPILLELEPPLKLVGDIHGQYYDLLRIFEHNGFPCPPRTNYLFLGDYVDRGKLSIETITVLFSYKLKYPDNFFLLRGNHEASAINRIYGFYDECKRRYSVKLWKIFCDVFNCLPVVAIISSKIVCMHGGLSPYMRDINQIKDFSRPTTVPDSGVLCDILWSDPDPDIKGYGGNDRGVSVTFGVDVVQRFLKRHDFDLIARAHQVVEDGYEFFANRQLVTIFSAPNYCGEFDNAAAVMSVDSNLMCSIQMLKPVEELERRRYRYNG